MIYTLEPIWKKSFVDVEHWSKEIDGKRVWIERHVGYRWGKCIFESDEKPNIDLENKAGFNVMDEIYNVDCESIDSCWVDYQFPDNLNEEICEQLEEMNFEDLEFDGWIMEDIETYITGPLKLTDEEGNECKGE
jgi:hypothetical protein